MSFEPSPCISPLFRGVENKTEASGQLSHPLAEQLDFGGSGRQSSDQGKACTDVQATAFDSSDEFLLEQLKEGNHGALALLFRRYARLVRTVAYRILRDAAEAEDLLQEVFLFIFRKWALFDASRGTARSWIVQVTYHRAIDRRRHLASRHFYANAELDETLLTIDGPMADTAFYERSIEGSLGTEMLSKIAEALSIDQRRTIQLYFFEGYTFEEIAELTKQMVGNVRNHYYRGLEKIRKLVFAPELRDK
jgi:RNA polymerase sigma-70 factor, ECF subfamily